MNNQTQTAFRLIATNNFEIISDAIDHALTQGAPINAEDWAQQEKVFYGRVSRRVAFKFAQSGASASMPQSELDNVDFAEIVQEYRNQKYSA